MEYLMIMKAPNTRKWLFRLSCMVFFWILRIGISYSQDQEIQQLLLNVQKLEQLKELLVQMKEKYQILLLGYNEVKSITEGNFRLHQEFFNELLQVSPKVKGYYKVAEILEIQFELISSAKANLEAFKKTSSWTGAEISFVEEIGKVQIKRGLRNLEEMGMILQENQFQMNDGERLEAIDRIHRDMKIILLNGVKRFSWLKQIGLSRENFLSEQITVKQILKND